MMSSQRTDSLYLPCNTQLLGEELVEIPSPTSEGNEEGLGAEARNNWPMAQGRDTMIDLVNKKRAELQRLGSEEHISSLQDLNHLLYTRDRLQELGCTFSTMGELVTYGHTVTLKEIEQLLRLGPIYDEQWSSLFASSPATSVDDDATMWSDMRTLKRVLTNEGLVFDSAYQRLTQGDGSGRILRLCSAYDDLHKLLSAMVPTRVLTPIVKQEEDPSNSFDDSGCFLGDERDKSDCMETRTHKGTRWSDSKTSSGVPRNIGWRFSDDITRCRDSMSEYSYTDIGENPWVVTIVPLPIVEDDLSRGPPPTQPDKPQVLPQARGDTYLRPFSQIRLRPGLAPLQSVTTPCVEQPTTHPNEGVSTGIDVETIMDFSDKTASAPEESVKAISIKKKGFRKWWRAVFGRTESAASHPR